MQPHGLQPTRLLCPWDSPAKNTGVGCHFLLQCRKVKSESEVAQSCLTFSDPMDCSQPGSSIHGIFQARALEWVAISFSKSRWVLSNSLQPHELQQTTLPCLSLSTRVCPKSCPLSQWCHPTISSSVALFSYCPQFFLASGSFQWVSSLHQVPKYWSFRLKLRTHMFVFKRNIFNLYLLMSVFHSVGFY